MSFSLLGFVVQRSQLQSYQCHCFFLCTFLNQTRVRGERQHLLCFVWEHHWAQQSPGKERSIMDIKFSERNFSDLSSAPFVLHRILVLDNGTIAEFDTPTNLIASKGIFYGMAKDAGLAWEEDPVLRVLWFWFVVVFMLLTCHKSDFWMYCNLHHFL